MTNASELTVVIKDEEKTLRKKFLLYEAYQATAEDAVIQRCIAETLKSFEGSPSDVRIKISFTL